MKKVDDGALVRYYTSDGSIETGKVIGVYESVTGWHCAYINNFANRVLLGDIIEVVGHV